MKTTFRIEHKIESFYTGGPIHLLPGDDSQLVCCHNEEIVVVDLVSGRVVKRMAGDNEHLTAFAVHPNGEDLVGSSKSMQMYHWNLSSGTLLKSWKVAHSAPVTHMTFHPTGDLLATGSSDRTVMVWDFRQGYITHRFQGHEGIVLCVYFHPRPDNLLLYSCSEDATIRCWDLITKGETVLRNHMSAVTGMALFPDGTHALSISRDKVLILWHLPSGTAVKTVPVYESLEACVMIQSPKGPLVATAGEQGYVRFWDSNAAPSNILLPQQHAQRGVIRSLVYGARLLIAATSDHNLISYNMINLTLERHLIGYNDEILDIRYLSSSLFDLAVATNSNLVRLYQTSSGNSMLLHGHRDTVLGIDVSPPLSLLATGSKDHTVRLYSTETWRCVAVLQGHTEAVQAVAFCRKGSGGSFVISAGKDRTIKSWEISSLALEKPNGGTDEPEAIVSLSTRFTIRGHDKDVNALAVAPNDSVFASASQDKTIKIWNTVTGELLGVLSGHKRGVWDVKFSPVDRAILSTSGDRTLKIWSLRDYTCLKTLEGHSSAVLRAAFISHGMQVLSASADGVIKLWTLKTNTCVSTFEAHEGKIWALAVSGDGERLVSGGSDSAITCWVDCTEADREAEAAKEDELRLQQQDLANSIRMKHWKRAVDLAFSLSHPHTLLTIFQDIFEQDDGEKLLLEMITTWDPKRAETAFSYCRDWTTSIRTAHTAHRVMNLIFSSYPPGFLAKCPNMKEMLGAQLPYTERHLARLDRLLQKSYILDYTLATMGAIVAVDGATDRNKKQRKQKRETSQPLTKPIPAPPQKKQRQGWSQQ